MPVSTSAHITMAMRQIILADPKSILDVGCGFGMWGFLARTYLDVFNHRVYPKDWQVRIDGIEFFEPYIQAHQRALYDNIMIGDVRDLAPEVEEYDLIICGDVIEHLEKEDGQKVLDQLYEKAQKALLVNIPLGEEGWDHPMVHDNPAELHRSQWFPKDFNRFPAELTEFPLPNGHYGMFFCPKAGCGESRLLGLLATAQDYERKGESNQALKYARAAIDMAPADPDGVALLSDLLLQQGKHNETLEVMARALQRNPDLDQISRAYSALKAKFSPNETAS